MTKITFKDRVLINHIIFWGVIFLVIIFVSNSNSELSKLKEIINDVSKKRIGKDIVLIEEDSSLQKYDYSIYYEPDMFSGGLPYKKYVGRKGKVVGVVEVNPVKYFWEIQLETGEMVYARIYLELDCVDQIEGAYFVEEYNEAKKKIGKFIWVDQNVWAQPLITEDRNVSHQLKHLEKVKVIDVLTRGIGHAYGGSFFYLKVKKETGEEGLIGYKYGKYHIFYFNENPINPSWDKKIIMAIKEQKVRLGMTIKQVLLSWGKPKDINRTVTTKGTTEQWVYGDKKYLYFENNKLTAYQD